MKPHTSIQQSFQVQYTYQLYFTEGVFSKNNSLFYELLAAHGAEEPIKILAVIDEEVHKHHPKLKTQLKTYCAYFSEIMELTEAITVPGGETAKNDTTFVEQVIQGINSNSICRHSFVIAIGGGAVIDMVGYAANIAHRGVKLIRIPTTVLAQNDAAVGVKNGINALGKKNFLGTFSPPYAIINDREFLKTLEQRDWISGIAEAVKVALVKDSSFFDYIEEHASKLAARDIETMQHVIYECAKLHMSHIANGGDPFESGSSRPLDFGHWAAHKLEHMTNYSLRHGEAVAIGMAIDILYAYKMGLIDETIRDRIILVLETIGFNLKIPISNEEDVATLLAGIEEFREHLGGKLTITLISEIGHKVDVHAIDLSKMKEAIAVLNEKYNLKSTY